MNIYISLRAEEFVFQFLNSENSVLLDVRTNHEYGKEHISNSVLAPGIETILNEFDRTKEYYVHCRVGGRCAIVAYKMVHAGFENVINLNDSLDNLVYEFEKAKSQEFAVIKAA